ncbi:carboxy-S-adenosyl-L-methionine synthase CmoA [Helicobacter monodelphidis]|uniref:carboxy-S-adenosyl-L-methionine synthase CmoA n=1 Tax=Helicobacter sp. 15-1451 TaxID=2004995 RepID=UPI000DCF62F3|nr:carboxy-S-adenosyl-L-methionine synthase CmoA [Helicobacter sp. 15-1451]RAX57243.1 carboxy-S-adenosyl-L-methionine synthase CmoA [Helicobacter sp. 15-1451]
MRDELFKQTDMKTFCFDERVSAVFDDMAERSIPYYHTTLELISEFSLGFLSKTQGRCYDLGSSTGNMLIEIALKTQNQHYEELQLIGIDNSIAMIERAKLKSAAIGVHVEFILSDIVDAEFLEADLFLCHYTLQFINPSKRLILLQRIFDHLKTGGALIMSEKIYSNHSFLNQKMIQQYYRFKESQGYSLGEIAKKREALENVLIPNTHEQNIELLKIAGFQHIENLFLWLNFETLIAIKL